MGATFQIYETLVETPPEKMGDLVTIALCAPFVFCWIYPVCCIGCVFGFLYVLLWPLALGLDAAIVCAKAISTGLECLNCGRARARIRAIVRKEAAERDLRLVQHELEKEGDGDSSVCPWCLGSFESPSPAPTLSCVHRYHGPCLMACLEAYGSCGLCHADIPMDLHEVDEAKTSEHQRHLRFYLSRLRALHPVAFAGPMGRGKQRYYQRNSQGELEYACYSDPSLPGPSNGESGRSSGDVSYVAALYTSLDEASCNLRAWARLVESSSFLPQQPPQRPPAASPRAQ